MSVIDTKTISEEQEFSDSEVVSPRRAGTSKTCRNCNAVGLMVTCPRSRESS